MTLLRRGAPLFVQALGLVIITLVAAQLISIAVIFNLPPPPPEFYRSSEIARAIKTGQSVPSRDGRALVVRHHGSVRAIGPDNPRRAEFKAEMSRLLDVPVNRIEIQIDNGPRFFVRRQPVTPPKTDPAPPPNRAREPFAREPGGKPQGKDEQLMFGDFKLGVRQSDGHWLIVEPKPTFFRFDSWQQRVLLILFLSVAAVTPLAWLFARRLAQPITAFADAAERLGKDPRTPPLAMSGSSEVLAAATAFNMMQERLRRYVEDRTAMVGAIAHDLRTPLTRLKFRIEAAPDDVRPKLAADIDQMEAMIAATLGFVRDTSRPAERTKLELSSLLESVMDEAAETGGDTTVDRSEKVVIEGDPVALKRLVANLVENALKYGGTARGRVYAEGHMAIIEIEDNGPGVPPAELERVFEPFYRGEPSRNRETGGIGLGLAVVRSLARAHGGDVTLHNRTGGGLRACVFLPA
ncbi:ATP-binding protein [Caulobacter sp.]|uniref:ATP-binding protein n=1 Tax=Caulobacter sp. TaxID=78 RepID=UPI001B2952BD|nr:ATP-binding protein [Caulobacter sp.]MBO9544758.1 HAMP domain-containing protein [Caulobacter sp.]